MTVDTFTRYQIAEALVQTLSEFVAFRGDEGLNALPEWEQNLIVCQVLSRLERMELVAAE